MKDFYTVNDVIVRLGKSPAIPELPIPSYTSPSVDDIGKSNVRARPNIGLAVASMKYHMTDEGWQVFNGLEKSAGYKLAGHAICTYLEPLPSPPPGSLPKSWYGGGMVFVNLTDVKEICKIFNPLTVVVQDKREWDLGKKDFRDPDARFTNVEYLRDQSNIFKVTILKDAQQRPEYHRDSAKEIGCHAWIVYYNPFIVKHLAPYVRQQHLIRTYHTIDKDIVPDLRSSFFQRNRTGAILSGAISNAYPLRKRLATYARTAANPVFGYIPHPGYHRKGCNTPEYLNVLSRNKVSICTASVYGYALRKIIEATACGCMVLTDLPADEVLPGIDGNLWRINSNTPTAIVCQLVREMIDRYSVEQQLEYARIAQEMYDYRSVCAKLAIDIENIRRNYIVS